MSITLDGTNGINTPAINAGNIVGEVAFFALNTAPSGWLKANGATVSRSTYADLFAAIGTTYGAGDGSTTFALPDMRGEFPRGWDDGRGVDSGRNFGTAQLDQMQRITGTSGRGRTRNNEIIGLFRDDEGVGAMQQVTIGASGFTPASVTSSTGDDNRVRFDSANSPNARVSATTDGETRARNVALLACIKF